MNKEKAIETMNALGAARIPFVFIIDYKLQYPEIYRLHEIPTDMFFDFNGFANFEARNLSQLYVDESIVDIKTAHAFNKYRHQFEIVQQHLTIGNSYLVNLTAPTEIKTNFSLFEIFCRSKALYKLVFENRFVVFSPEQFIQIKEGIISTFPMKGTIDANVVEAEKKILESKKEQEEHATIVDLLRNDLSKVAQNVVVKRYRYINHIYSSMTSLLQVSSEIEGTLPENYLSQLGTIVFSLLPAGSICGAPKQKTLEIIEEVENYKRGFYTGIMGYFDGETFDSAVMIRFIEQQNDKLFFKSGGGITYQSNCEAEYQELINKIYVPITGNN